MKLHPPKFVGFARKPPLRIPPFHAVPGRARADGWTPLRQAEFIGLLAETRSVTEAARGLGMARETAYRLRQRKWSGTFNAAWDEAMGARYPQPRSPNGHKGRSGHENHEGHSPAPREVTNAELMWRVDTGLWQVIFRDGCYAGVKRKACNSELLELHARLGGGRRNGPSPVSSGERSQF